MERRFPFVVAALVALVMVTITVSMVHAETTSNLRIKLVSSLFLAPTVDNSDIWVWHDPVTSKRYAVIGEYPGVAAWLFIIEVTNPSTPVLVSTITNAPTFDMKVRYPYLYSVDGDGANDDGAIYDITNPASPVFVSNMQSSHNITIADNGYIYYSYYGVTTSDLNPDPTTPNPIWDDNSPFSYYGHDVTVVGNRMYDFNGWSGVANVYDITAFNADTSMVPVLLRALDDPGPTVYPHNGWPSVDGNYLYITDELSSSPDPDLIAWDISDIANGGFTPTITDTYADNDATIHNIMVLNNFIYASYYSAGVKVFDIGTPGTIKLIDEYDTSAFTGDGYVGAWGIHCLFGDYFYASDMQNGLYIFELVPEPSLWKDDGVALAGDANNGTLVPAPDPEPDYTVPDGSGGAIVLFDREGGDRDIYAQRVDVNGNCLWGPNGIPVVNVVGDVTLADVISDGNGGAIVLWTDPRDTPAAPDVYVQWMGSNGGPKFAFNGLLVSDNVPGEKASAEALQLVDDNEFVAVWTQDSGVASTTHLYCQRIDDTGTPQWGSPTRPALVLSNQRHSDICQDGAGGWFVIWEDDRDGSADIFAQRIDGAGVRQWGLGGVAIYATADEETRPRIVYVNSDEATAVFTRAISGATDHVIATEINDDGTLAWTSTMSSIAGNKRDVQIAFDGSSGVFAVWEDNRGGNWDIYGMYFHGSGGAVAGWPADGLGMATTALDETSPTLTSAEDNTMIAAWTRDPTGDGRIQTRKVEGFGAAASWPAGTLDVCTHADIATSPSLAIDSNGDAIVAWRDTRTEGAFAHRIEASCGTLGGNLPPMVTTIIDTPGDGGGFVDVTWNAAGQDGAGMVVQDYDILYAENPQYGWNATGVTVPASGQASYTVTAPTAQDGTPMWYLVVANGGVSTCTWESFPAAGTSIDDPPTAPQGMAVAQQGNYYNLTWFPPDPVAPDFSHYNVYRGVVGGAAVSAATAAAAWAKIGETPTESFRDETAPPGPAYEWSVRAVDTQGNEGPFAEPDTVSDTVTDVAAPSYPLLLGDNYPNPFSRTTDLRLSLSQPANVTVSVYDVRGRRVARMALGQLGSGPHAVPFDGSRLPSGVYFYRAQIGAEVFTRKMVIGR